MKKAQHVLLVLYFILAAAYLWLVFQPGSTLTHVLYGVCVVCFIISGVFTVKTARLK